MSCYPLKWLLLQIQIKEIQPALYLWEFNHAHFIFSSFSDRYFRLLDINYVRIFDFFFFVCTVLLMVFKSWAFLASYVFEIDAENVAYRVSMKWTWLSTVCVHSYYRILTRSKLIFILGGNSGWGNGTGNRQ